MYEVRPFPGTPAELAEFIRPIWTRTYTEKMAIPLWSPEFLEWALDWDNRDHLVTAWDGDRLIGCLLATVFEMKYLDKTVKGTHGSFLTVDPEYRRKGIAKLLADGMHSVNERLGIDFELGYLYTGHGFSMGPKFWKKRKNSNILSSAGYWTRVLDHQAVANWDYNALDRIGARVLGWVQRSPQSPQLDCIRDYQAEDLSQCQELLQEITDQSRLGLVWNASHLENQLAHETLSRTLVYEKEGRLCGLVNYCRLDFQANGVLPVALIDLIALQRLSSREKQQFLNQCLSEMDSEGIKLVMLLKPGPTEGGTLWKTGFVPRLNDFALQMLPTKPDFMVESTKNLHVLWR